MLAPNRPAAVVVALILTFVGSGLQLLLGLMFLALASSPDFVQGISEGLRVGSLPQVAVFVGGAIVLGFGLLLEVLAVLAWRGRNGARIALIVLGAIAVLLALDGVINGEPQGILTLLWIGTCVVLLCLPVSRHWYQRQR